MSREHLQRVAAQQFQKPDAEKRPEGAFEHCCDIKQGKEVQDAKEPQGGDFDEISYKVDSHMYELVSVQEEKERHKQGGCQQPPVAENTRHLQPVPERADHDSGDVEQLPG